MYLKKSLMIGTSIAALLAGASMANAQTPQGGPDAGPNAGSNMQEPAGGKGGAPAGNVTPRGEAKGFDRGAPGERGEAKGRENGAPGERGQARGADNGGPDRDTVKKRDKKVENEPSPKSGPSDARAKAEKSADDAKPARRNKAVEADNQPGGKNRKQAVKVQVDQQKKAELKQRVDRSSLKRSKDVDIDINIGVGVPQSVTLYSLPPTWVTIVPAYRGYRYLYVGEAILIVDPDTYIIVDVIYI